MEVPLKFTTQASTTQASYLIAVRRSLPLAGPARNCNSPRKSIACRSTCSLPAKWKARLNETDVTTPLGLRNRAILETFYSTAIRCGELVDLEVYDWSPSVAR